MRNTLVPARLVRGTAPVWNVQPQQQHYAETDPSADPPAGDPPKDPDNTPPSADKPYTPPATQADLDRIVSQRAARAAAQAKAEFGDYDQLKKDSDALRKIKEGELTEAQREKARADELAGKVSEFERRDLQREVAAAKGVPLNQAHRLTGKNKAELEADADAFLSDFTPAAPGGTGPKPNPQQGKPTGTKTSGVDAGRERFEARRGKKPATP